MPDGQILFDGGVSRFPPVVVTVGIVLLACMVGAVIPIYIGMVGDDGMGRLMALPAMVLLSFLFLLSRKMLLLAIILFRASADLLFESSKLSIGGHQIGVGGLLNAFVLLIALLLVIERPGFLPKKIVVSMWLAFLVTAFLGVIAAPLKIDAFRTFLGFMSYAAIFVSAFYFVRSAKDFRFCVRLVVLSSSIPAAYALFDFAQNGLSGGLAEFRLQSTFSHPNIFAFYLTLLVSLLLYMLKCDEFGLSSRRRTGVSMYMLYLLCLLLFTQTRSAWAACFAMFAAYGLLFQRRYLVYVILIPLFALFVPGIPDRLADLASGNEYVQFAQLNSFAWRRLMWESGLKWMQADHYLLGYGVDSFKFYSPLFFPLAGGGNFGAHSVYVQWLFEVGILGLLAYLWLLGRLLWLLRLMAPTDKLGAFISISLIVEYLTISFSDNMFAYLAFNWYFWFILGAACAVVVAEKRRLEESRSSETHSRRINANAVQKS